MNHKEDLIAGRNAVIEALRAKKPIDKIFVLDGCQDGPIRTIVREAKKTDAILKFVDKERLTQLTNEHHQGVVAIVAAYQNTIQIKSNQQIHVRLSIFEE